MSGPHPARAGDSYPWSLAPGRTGPEVYEIMRRSGHPPPVLFMSGYPATNLESGVSLDPDLPFLAKPWTMEDLVGAVRDTLARR